jgi:hypothetical protein
VGAAIHAVDGNLIDAIRHDIGDTLKGIKSVLSQPEGETP